MPTADIPYPPTPIGVPPEITRPDSAYRGRVAAMIVGLFLFLSLYLILVALSGLLAWWLLVLPMPDARGRGVFLVLIVKYGGALAAGLLAVFLVKGLFKGHRVERAGHIPVEEADHPDLFAFVRRVHQDTGAPPPRRIYVSSDVNAALVYDTSLVNLVVPPKKDLLIGLGLVNVVNLVEFKAVLAHEFGHFAQRSVGFGSYLYVANRVMNDVIYGRDALDKFVDTWAGIDIRVSFPAWGLKGVLWVVRGILSGLYRGLNLLHLSLGRQMEFNADNVAVSVTGSDALIHCLSRLGFASECLAYAAGSLDAAADHGLFSDDLFFHQTRSAERLRKVRKDDRLGLPPELPADTATQVAVFEPVNDGIPEKYRSHPADHAREQNAKRYYVRSPRDDRSPWVLFHDVDRLKRTVSKYFYKQALNRKELYEPSPAARVQEFIDAEHAETTYDPRYHGWYDDRFVEPGDLTDRSAPWLPAEVTAWLATWPPPDLEDRVKANRERNAEAHLLQGLKSGDLQLKGETFPFRGRDRTKRDVDRLLTEVQGELTADGTSFQALDRAAFLAHWSLAHQLDGGGGTGAREANLLERYRFHMAIQGLLRGMLGEQARLQAILQFLSGNPKLEEGAFHEIRGSLAEVHQALSANLDDARGYRTPALTNVPAGSNLYDLIVDRGDTRLSRLDGDSISGEWMMKLVNRVEGVLTRVKRLHFKSLGSLLDCQHRLAVEWLATQPTAKS